MVGAVTLVPGRGRGGVNEAAFVGVGGQFSRDSAAGIVQGTAVTNDAAIIPFALLAINTPSAQPLAISPQDDVTGPRGRRPVLMDTLEEGKIGRVHHILVDVVTAG